MIAPVTVTDPFLQFCVVGGGQDDVLSPDEIENRCRGGDSLHAVGAPVHLVHQQQAALLIGSREGTDPFDFHEVVTFARGDIIFPLDQGADAHPGEQCPIGQAESQAVSQDEIHPHRAQQRGLAGHVGTGDQGRLVPQVQIVGHGVVQQGMHGSGKGQFFFIGESGPGEIPGLLPVGSNGHPGVQTPETFMDIPESGLVFPDVFYRGEEEDQVQQTELVEILQKAAGDIVQGILVNHGPADATLHADDQFPPGPQCRDLFGAINSFQVRQFPGGAQQLIETAQAGKVLVYLSGVPGVNDHIHQAEK